jgi:hypothetical protein
MLENAALAYAERNPLGGPATRFEAVASRLRAGDDYAETLMDFGLADIDDTHVVVPREPTEAMVNALIDEMMTFDYVGDRATESMNSAAKSGYRAMLSAKDAK